MYQNNMFIRGDLNSYRSQLSQKNDMSLVGIIVSGENCDKLQIPQQSSVPAIWECKYNVARSLDFSRSVGNSCFLVFVSVLGGGRWGRKYTDLTPNN